MKEPMNKYRIFLVCASVWFAAFTTYYVFAVWAQLWNGDGVSGLTVAALLLNLFGLCHILLASEWAMLLQAARDAKKKWDKASLPAKASLEVALQRIDRQAVTDGDIETLNRTTRAMSAALDNYVDVSKRLYST